MSKDIRSYFTVKGSKKDSNPREPEKVNIQKKKINKRAIVIDSDSDDDIQKKKINKRVSVIDSDSDDKTPSPKRSKQSSDFSKETKSNKTPKEELKIGDIKDIFGNDKVKRSVSKSSSGKNNIQDSEKNKETFQFENICSDSEFEATLRQVDEIEELHTRKSKEKDKLKSKHTNIKCEATVLHKEGEISSEHEQNNTNLSEQSIIKIEKDNNISKEEVETNTKVDTPRETIQKPDSDSVESPSLDPVEKKRQHALNYMRFLQREGPKNLGSKEIPKGKPNCFSGLVFVITGVLDSLDRDQAATIIKQYGGKVTSNVSRNTSYLIIGDEPGHAKVGKASSLGTPQLNEEGLLNLIVTKSNLSEIIVSKDKTNKNQKRKSTLNHSENKTPSKDSNSSKKLKYAEKSKREDSQYTESKGHTVHNEINKAENSKTNANSSSKNVVTKNAEKNNFRNSDSGTFKVEKDMSGKSSNQFAMEHKMSTSQKLSRYSVENNSHYKVKTMEDNNVVPSLWVDKYRPTDTKQIIGQQGDRSVLKKLTTWLNNWFKNNSSSKKHSRPSPWAKNDDGAFFKASLLSGPPGIGKTTMAHLVSKELDFDIVEFNASDTRSKKLLHVQVAELLSSKSLFGYFHSSDNVQPSVKHVLIMDEVDGMAGNEDRGGIQEMIQLIKTSHIPIIFMCNDRNHPKIRSLVNYCFDLRVNKPRLEQIRGAMMSICFKEGLKVSPEALNDIISGANQDMRQILHHLSMWSVKCKELSTEEAKLESQKAKKDTKLGPWDVLKKVFSAQDHKTMTIHEKSDLFFHDYSISPLFVQENYLSVVPTAAKGNTIKVLELVAQASESISMGDVVDRSIRSKSAWNLLPVQAMFSSVIPGDAMEGYLNSQINFPTWLGKNSRRNKFDRLLQDLHVHMRLSTSGSKQAINLDYLTQIRNAILHPLISDGASGVPTSLCVLQEYHLMREDMEGLLELTLWPNQKDPMSLVESKVKAALTRAYNKEGIMTPYSMATVIKKRIAASSQDFEEDEDGEEDVLEENNDIYADSMIKAKKRPAAKVPAASSSAPKRGRGKGKAK